MDTLKKINQLVEESKRFPDPTIQYSFELPDVKGITPTNFFGVKAVFNKDVPVSTGASIIYKY